MGEWIWEWEGEENDLIRRFVSSRWSRTWMIVEDGRRGGEGGLCLVASFKIHHRSVSLSLSFALPLTSYLSLLSGRDSFEENAQLSNLQKNNNISPLLLLLPLSLYETRIKIKKKAMSTPKTLIINHRFEETEA